MPPKTSQFPWDQVKVETLRTVCRDLGVAGYVRRRDDMSAVINAIESEGLEDVLKKLEAEKEKNRDGSTTSASRQAPLRPARQANRTLERPASSSPRRSGRESRMTERRRASLKTLMPLRPSRATPARRRKSVRSPTLAAKKASFDGVMMPRRPSRAAQETEGGSEATGTFAPKTFTQLAADADDSMEVDQVPT
ncbi:hypothetical protein BC835DRAFT_1415557 [Cytidiella melzeri]|nr:hypothetical protein BC835DRAFT_1415557 [Cytidiella melzeri]